jgi:eukaryotic-like serine/threonine-protein kinase
MNPGTRLGPYEILSPIGAGGMGEVYKGRDTRLERSVAIKILPAEFAHNAQLKLRFEREAKSISQLEHPHICRLYDVGEANAEPRESSDAKSVQYLVMELLEGESLADRLARGPLPLGDVLRYGMQIAEALDRAHRAGIVHRDLKPGNVMITKSGAKLLDFGLAKTDAGQTTAFGGSVLATEQKPLTEQGTIIGTFQYMAPEQFAGEEADGRTDIFAFGALMYEMLTGRRAFQGKTRTSLIGAIVGGEPQRVSEIQPLTPPALEHVILKCLEKDRDDRWQSARDIASELQWIGDVGSKAGVATAISMRRTNRERVAWGIAAVAVLAAIVVTTGYMQRAPRPQPMQRFVLVPPPQTSLFPFDEAGMALAPDGLRLAFVANSDDGRRQLWIRSFSEFEARAVPETANASYPFWSPDGRFIAFFAEGKLKKIDASGGPPQIICDAPGARGGTWGEDGTILFAPNVYSSIHIVPASGGVSKAVTTLNPEIEVTHRWPYFLPGGSHFLYVSRSKSSEGGRAPGQLFLASLGSKEKKVLMSDATNVTYVAGHLLFGRDQRLMAQRFDLKAGELRGEAFVLVGDKLSYWEPKNLLVFAATERTLVYLPESPAVADLRILDREGNQLDLIAAESLTDLQRGAAFSPDGARVAYAHADGATGRSDIWMYDVEKKRSSRFTFQPGRYWSLAWTRDSSRLYFASAPESMGNFYQKPLKGSTAIEPVVASGRWLVAGDVSPDGTTVIYSEQGGENGYDLWRLTLGEEPELFLATPFDEVDPKFSPDGRWLTYTSNASGRPEVYVRPVEGSSDQWQISSAGGNAARWRSDGREILYMSADGRAISVPVQPGDSFDPGEAKELFALGNSGMGFGTPLQDVSPDGKTFLIATRSRTATETVHALFHWSAGLAKAPAR